MGKKVGLTLSDVVTAAAAIADSDGLEAASLRAVADKLGIKTPSLYNHVAGLPGLRRELARYAASELAIAFSAATKAGSPADVIRQSAGIYRRFAKEHPGIYESLLPAPKPDEDPELYDALVEPVAILADALAEAGIEEAKMVPLIRALRSMVHGFVDLELKDGFGMPDDIDESFDRAVDVVVAGVLRVPAN